MTNANENEAATGVTGVTGATKPTPSAPIKPDQEWANALTHGLAALGSVVMGYFLIRQAATVSTGMMIACLAYITSVFGTFFCSTLSHVIFRQPLLDKLRAWDQAMIYTMISGTYTPIVYLYCPDSMRIGLLVAIWVAAAAGFLTKVAVRHRINSIGTVSYLLLGWLPSLPLVGHVPGDLVGWMVAGGVLYTLGVGFLVNDSRIRYLHAVWHLFVMAAAGCHYYGIWNQVVAA
ncbi:MAG: hemolysin III family protein [Rubripirellula sp.]